ncbi:oxidative stress-induced growth inhibitor 1 [Trichonephila clavipes]|nr:oxidative stress-induced growth inhibitor 1 [Trichonephila clavipes]
MDGSTLTISLSSWMELPNLSIREWDASRNRLHSTQSGLRQKRATVGTVADYYSCYVKSQGLSSFFVNNSVVTSIAPVPAETANDLGYKHLWKIHGYIDNSSNLSIPKRLFNYVSPHVVLATGNSDQPNELNVEGQELPFVLHSLADLEKVIHKNRLLSNSDSLVIVGAGLSAADAVIAARFYGIPIIHVFRRSVNDPDLIFNKLPQDIYPEYHKVHQMMKDSNRVHYEGYKAFSCSKIHSIKPDGTVIITSCEIENFSVCKVSYVLVLIGQHPDMSFLSNDLKLGIHPERPIDCKKNPIDINLYTHESISYPGLYAVGPLVGDNFVRFVQGGCLAVASHIQNDVLNKIGDEAHFWLNGYVNKQNCRIWSEANPQVYVETPLHPEKLTVWCALWAGGIIGPYFFKNDEGHNVTVNGDRYRAMTTNCFIPELNNHDVQELWFQQDGATCHTARATIDLLKDTFGDRLISRFGPVNWPPRSCDLTPLDYFLWGYVKALVYADKPQTLGHLEDNIRRLTF